MSDYIAKSDMNPKKLHGKMVLMTNGPTQEALDPVRYITNRSTGKMGNAIAESLLSVGAKVVMIAGPLSEVVTHPNLELIKVKSANEMLSACLQLYTGADAFVFAAAVGDYRPIEVAEHKIKKALNELDLKMVKNPDIAYEIGKRKSSRQLSVGFALETENGMMNAFEKMRRKRFDLTILNSLEDHGAGFEVDTNKVSIIEASGNCIELPLLSKKMVAKFIVREMEKFFCDSDVFYYKVADKE